MIRLAQLVFRLRCWCGFVGCRLREGVGGERYQEQRSASRGRVLGPVEGREEVGSLCARAGDLLVECIRNAREGDREVGCRIERAEERVEGRRLRSWAFCLCLGLGTVRFGLVVRWRVERRDLLLSSYFRNTCQVSNWINGDSRDDMRAYQIRSDPAGSFMIVIGLCRQVFSSQ